MVSLVLISHSLPLAKSLVNLVQQIVPESFPIAIAAGVDDPENPFGTDVIKIKTAIESVYSDDGVLVLMDLGSAILSAEMALELLNGEQQKKVKLVAAPFVEGTITAAVVASTGATLKQVIEETEQSLNAKLSHLDTSEINPNIEPSSTSLGKPLKITLTIKNSYGLHIRPAAQFVSLANQFTSEIKVKNITSGSDFINGKSINQVMLLGVKQGEQIAIEANGNDASSALQALQDLINNNLSDTELITYEKLPDKTPEYITKTDQLTGIPASPGVAIAPLLYYQPTLPQVTVKHSENSSQEWKSLQLALENAQQQISNLTPSQNPIFQAHLLYLNDPQLLAQTKDLIFTQKYTASQAWKTVIEQAIADYQNLKTDYLQARVIDLLDLGVRVLKILLGGAVAPLKLEQPSILIASQFLPSEVAQFNPQQVLGLCTVMGSSTDHSAIIASLLGIPMVVGVGEELLNIKPYTTLKIDGTSGLIQLNPSSETITVEPSKPSNSLKPINHYDYPVSIVANIIGVEDAKLAIANGAKGVGLLRTEFLYLERLTPPTETEQVQFYQAIAEVIHPLPLTIRTVDLGGDKPIPYLKTEKEANPFLGWRGIRQSLEQPEIFKTQLRAILRVNEKFNLRLMLPMISSVKEVRATKQLLEEVKKELQEENIACLRTIPLGIMLEVPAAVIMADQLAEEVDFFSLGTNDLTQYIMAADRTNPKVANLANGLHPALLRLIKQSVKIAHEKGIKISLCGQLASTPSAIPILLPLEIDELSVNPPMIPQIFHQVRIISCHKKENQDAPE